MMTNRAQETIERSPPGYPQFSALIGVHPAFSVSARFPVARARLLLRKQQRALVLEKRLEELDLQEQKPLYLGSFESDRNEARIQVLGELDEALKDYDDLLQRSVAVLHLPRAPQRSIDSLVNWIKGTGSISRKEANFLERLDLCILGGSEGPTPAWIESCIERIIISVQQRFKISAAGPSRQQRVFIFEGPAFRIIAHSCITVIVVMLLLIPVAILRSTSSAIQQMVCITLTSVLFTIVLSGSMNARPGEIFGASATYVALLVIFLTSQPSGQATQTKY